MATLRFSFGTMGSGKSTLALQIHHNLASRHLYGLLLTRLDREGMQVTSRLGVAAPAIQVEPDLDIHALAVHHWPLHYMVCDEVQFYSPEQCDQLARVVDDLKSTSMRSVSSPISVAGCSKARSACSRSPTNASRCRSRHAAGAGHARRTTPASSTDVVVYEGETVMVGDTLEPGAMKHSSATSCATSCSAVAITTSATLVIRRRGN